MSSQAYFIVYGEGVESENPQFAIVGDLGEECTATIETPVPQNPQTDIEYNYQ